jgi:hypothetical protein
MLLLVAFAAETNFPFVGKLLVLADMGSARTELSWQLRVATRQTVSMSGYSRLFKCWNGPLLSVHNTTL